MYLCYDIKGIQRFIYSVPKLKCVIGASAMIADLDEGTRELELPGCQRVFAAGGHGAFQCDDDAAISQVTKLLKDAAHAVGLDIRFGVDEQYSQAAKYADETYPFCPALTDVEPCETSGLWPVKKGTTHPLIRARMQKARKDDFGKRLIEELVALELPDRLRGYRLKFLRNVNPEIEYDDDGRSHYQDSDEQVARIGQKVLGRRNRWAVIAMDGNDMGKQFAAAERNFGSDNAKLQSWVQQMSPCLTSITRQSFLSALRAAIQAWVDDESVWLDNYTVDDWDGERTLFLPFRPLILGGDDIVLLCHSEYALQFVESMAAAFRDRSRQAARDYAPGWLWPATGNELSISAGILYCKTTFPLHMAIPYAERLLAEAKRKFRGFAKSGKRPTPSAVDWDVITDPLVDTPAERRRRELQFKDLELGGKEVRLTQRPYLLYELIAGQPTLSSVKSWMAKLESLPNSLRAQLLPALQRPWSERVAFLASFGKRHRELRNQLWEDEKKLGPGWSETGNVRETCIPDALLLLEEERRMIRPTA